MLKLKNIVKKYKVADTETIALDKVSIEFRKNEFVSILGPSGCGKTTLLNIIGGLDKMTSGDLFINGKSTKNYSASDWDTYRNHSIGFVFQSYNLISHQTVLGNVELALTLSGVSRKVRKAKAIEALKKVGLESQLNKRPNQLSGGQMQRVAIARAIVNDPEILLADEPTGALDTETSVQILEIIKEIAKDRLVIMVTHNPELANRYSTRIIKLLDGKVIDDSMPYENYDLDVKANDPKEAITKKKKTSMSFSTALSLSFRNLFTKKVRTIITAFAGSIGIIGIALVLSLSNGFQTYIDKMQTDTLSAYPLTIGESAIDLTSMIKGSSTAKKLEKYPTVHKIFINKMISSMENMMKKNIITTDYVDYVREINPDLFYEISYSNGYNVANNIAINNTINLMGVDVTQTTTIYSSMQALQGMNSSCVNQLLDNSGFIKNQYDIFGDYPTEANQVIIVVDEKNQLSDYVCAFLGLMSLQDATIGAKDEISFEELYAHKFDVYYNDSLYVKESNKFSINQNLNATPDMQLEIVGIARAKKETSVGALSSGMLYTRTLADKIMAENADSEIVNWMKNPTNAGLNPLTGTLFATTSESDNNDAYKEALRSYGGDDSINEISIFAKDFKSKETVKDYLDEYNVGKAEVDQVKYDDTMSIVISSLTTIVDAVSYVLIAFTAISLIVSSIMIAIITYVSVIERTKEIGVLRSIGARKMDISRVFNAETFIIGLSAGVFGVLVAALLDLPINLIVTSLVDGLGNIAILNPIHGLVLVIISILLTLLSGLIPARIAAKKDPVNALRSE